MDLTKNDDVIKDTSYVIDDVIYSQDYDGSLQSSYLEETFNVKSLYQTKPEVQCLNTTNVSSVKSSHACYSPAPDSSYDDSLDDSIDDDSIELESRYYSISEEEIRTPTYVGQDADLNKTQESIRSDMTAFMEDELCFSTIRNKAFKERRPSLLKRIKNYTKNKTQSKD